MDIQNRDQQEPQTVSKPKRKAKKSSRPANFKEFENGAKSILKARGIDYYDWLHEQHTNLVNSVVLNNIDSIGQLVDEQK
ncbi:hypothetical protein [Bacillus sp. FSL M8-0168]|uniref:hypothetical protein n=1 Tax=Bacillus sp. FSL M8-0168 TaxID=2921614 RepID=UPI0030FD802E